MRGIVKDTAFRPLAGAVVEVIAGTNTGMSTTTDSAGQFSLSGGFDNTTRFRASKEDHVASTTTLNSPLGGSISFHLAVLAPPVSMAGDYTLTFVADSACASLPAALKTRTYAATVTPNSADKRAGPLSLRTRSSTSVSTAHQSRTTELRQSVLLVTLSPSRCSTMACRTSWRKSHRRCSSRLPVPPRFRQGCPPVQQRFRAGLSTWMRTHL